MLNVNSGHKITPENQLSGLKIAKSFLAHPRNLGVSGPKAYLGGLAMPDLNSAHKIIPGN